MNYQLPTTNFRVSTLPVLLFLSILLMSACSGVKNVTYFQKMNATDSLSQSQPASVHTATIKPLDLLTITVVSTVPETSVIYNLVVPQITENTMNTLTSMPTLQTYLVDEDGNIDFPVFGKLKVKGMTRKDLVNLLQDKMETEFKNERPVVTIRITNYTVNIVGEVNRPGKYVTTNERITIFEGLALAGDLTIYGKRDKVKVLRENADGTKKFLTVDLNDQNVIYSPGYFLEQNDVVYVEPNGAKSRTSSIGAAENLSISALSILISLSSLVVTVLRR